MEKEKEILLMKYCSVLSLYKIYKMIVLQIVSPAMNPIQSIPIIWNRNNLRQNQTQMPGSISIKSEMNNILKNLDFECVSLKCVSLSHFMLEELWNTQQPQVFENIPLQYLSIGNRMSEWYKYSQRCPKIQI